MSATPEQIRAAYEAVDEFSTAWGACVEDRVAAIRAVLPPLPEPQRPRIKTVRELMLELMRTGAGSSASAGSSLKWGIDVARAEILAWLEWETTHAMGGHYPDDEETKCSAYGTVHKLLAALRESRDA